MENDNDNDNTMDVEEDSPSEPTEFKVFAQDDFATDDPEYQPHSLLDPLSITNVDDVDFINLDNADNTIPDFTHCTDEVFEQPLLEGDDFTFKYDDDEDSNSQNEFDDVNETLKQEHDDEDEAFLECIDDPEQRNLCSNVIERLKQIEEEMRLIFVQRARLRAKKAQCIAELKDFSSSNKGSRAHLLKCQQARVKRGEDCADTGGNRAFTCLFRFGMPYFKSSSHFPATVNGDVKRIQRDGVQMLARIPRDASRKFTTNETCWKMDRLLLDYIKKARVTALQTILQSLESTGNLTGDEVEQAQRNIEDAIEAAKQVKDMAETRDWNVEMDFDELSSAFPKFNADEVERVWNLVANPKLSRTEFSSDESDKLKEIATKYNCQDWDSIAAELGTHRSGYVCFSKYMGMMKKGINVPWTAEEQAVLMKFAPVLQNSDCKKFGIWRTIRRLLPNRSYTQINSYWNYTVRPNLKKGRFSEEEHAKLQTLMSEGKSFLEIAEIFANRSTVQLRSHFDNETEKTEFKQGEWSQEEIEKLLELVDEYGNDWVAISKAMGTRSRTQVRTKHLWLTTCKRRNWSLEEKNAFDSVFEEYFEDFEAISMCVGTRKADECETYYRNTYRKKCAEKVKRVRAEHQARKKANGGPPKRGNISGEEVANTSTAASPQKKRKTRQGSANPNSWDEEEERLLLKLIDEQGFDFVDASAYLKKRTASKCRDKYRNMKKRALKEAQVVELPRPSDDVEGGGEQEVEDAVTGTDRIMAKRRKRTCWSKDERNLLRNLMKADNFNLSVASKRFKNKTLRQCRHMYHVLVSSAKDEGDGDVVSEESNQQIPEYTDIGEGEYASVVDPLMESPVEDEAMIEEVAQVYSDNDPIDNCDLVLKIATD